MGWSKQSSIKFQHLFAGCLMSRRKGDQRVYNDFIPQGFIEFLNRLTTEGRSQYRNLIICKGARTYLYNFGLKL